MKKVLYIYNPQEENPNLSHTDSEYKFILDETSSNPDLKAGEFFAVITNIKNVQDKKVKNILRQTKNILIYGEKFHLKGINNHVQFKASLYYYNKSSISVDDVKNYVKSLKTSMKDYEIRTENLLADRKIKVNNMEKKRDYIEIIEKALQDLYPKKSQIPTIVSIVDELLINGIRYGISKDSNPTKDYIEFGYKITKENFHFVVQDFAGKLDLQHTYNLISSGFETDGKKKKSGGMGIKNTLNLATTTHIYVEHSKQTLIHCCFSAKRPRKKEPHNFFICNAAS